MSMTIKVEELRAIAVLDCIEIAHGSDGPGDRQDEIHLGVQLLAAQDKGDADETEATNIDLAVRRHRADALATDLERMAAHLRKAALGRVTPTRSRVRCRECESEFHADDLITGTCLTCR
jgi:hypothetical protein